jgi:DNA-binding transcriptional MerR regulator
MANFNDGLCGSFLIARSAGLSLERLRYWESLGIIQPSHIQCGRRRFKRYSRQDIERVRAIKKLVDEDKYSLGGAIAQLKQRENESIRRENNA